MFKKFTFESLLPITSTKLYIVVCLVAAPGFWFEGDIQQKCTHQILLKNFEKIYKKFA